MAGPSLQLRLVLLALTTLLLPWAGCRYAREVDGALREAERASLEGIARTLAASLQGRTDLLYRSASAPTAPRPGPWDLQPLVLLSSPTLDGDADDWPRDISSAVRVRGDPRHTFRMLAGVHERTLFLLLDVAAPEVIFTPPDTDPLDETTAGERVWLGFEDAEGTRRVVLLSFGAGGPVAGQRVESAEYGERRHSPEPRINGALQLHPGGYRMELALPLSMLGERFGVLVEARAARGGPALAYGTLHPDTLEPAGRLIVAAPALAGYLQQFMQPGTQLTVRDPAGAILARIDALDQLAPGTPPSFIARLYRLALGTPREPALAADAPVADAAHHDTIARVQLRRTDRRWLSLRDRALARMLDLTLAITATVLLLTVVFAARLAMRLARLRAAAEAALDQPALPGELPETHARDELGDLSRAFGALLARIGADAEYLRRLAGRLGHELRTPLSIVRSSLDNLDAEALGTEARAVVRRARAGADRLGNILQAMGAATRVEAAISAGERVEFDLVPVLASAVEGYRVAYPAWRFETQLELARARVAGSPELLVQLLDKLIDNAVDFSPQGSTIPVRLRPAGPRFVLEVENPGPPLDPAIRERLFESLWSSRPAGGGGPPHLGLGLYVVRLIAEWHRGSVEARDLEDGRGVRILVRIPAVV